MSPSRKKINSEQLEAALHEGTGALVKNFNLDGCVQILFYEDRAKVAVFVNGEQSDEAMKAFLAESAAAIIEAFDTPYTTYGDDEGKGID